MVKLSRYTHVIDLDDAIALYHSLRMKPVYLNRERYEDLQDWLASSSCNSIETAPSGLASEIEELVKYKILTQSEGEDDRVLQFVKSKIPKPMINVCYLILSEQCNLACKYCFLGNNDIAKREKFDLKNMTKETADQAIQFFIKQIKLTGIYDENNKPVIIFYGGEPLVNYDLLVYVAKKINALREVESCMKYAELSVVTNGLLLNDARLLELKELGVSIGISIDGFDEKANEMRVDTSGRPIFDRLLHILDRCKEIGVKVTLSVTLSEETIKSKSGILDLLEKYDIQGFGFNIMMSDEDFVLPESYNTAAAQFILDEFVELRKRGIYEDRIMRKLKSFQKAQVYFSDCAATAGGQIVVAPNGSVGICHGCLHDKKYFVADIWDDTFNAAVDANYIEWSQLTPVNKDECQECIALGICGGGCPLHAMKLKKGNSIHSLDERFCVHAKMTLDFLIKDLYRIISKGN